MSQLRQSVQRVATSSLPSPKQQLHATEENLTKYQNKIFPKENEVDADALREYLNSVRSCKMGRERIFTEKTEITNIIGNVFKMLKKMMVMSQNENCFGNILSVYMELIKSRENSRHYFGIIEDNLNEVINMEVHRKSKKLYMFIAKIFEFNPYIVYKILQSKPEFLQENNEDALRIYELFIKYAADKKNTTLFLKQIKRIIDKQPQQLGRLKILLTHLPETASESLIKSIDTYINEQMALNLKNSKQQFEICLLEVMELFVSLPWAAVEKKNQIIIKYLNTYYDRKEKLGPKLQHLLNDILHKLEITNENQLWVQTQVKRKIAELETSDKKHIENFRFLRIIFDKLGREKVEAMIPKQQIQRIVEKGLEFQLAEELVKMLDSIKSLQIYDMRAHIHKNLKTKIESILSKEKKPSNREKQRPESADTPIQYTKEDKRLALRSLTRFKFQSIQVYSVLKEHVLKNELSNKSAQMKQQVIRACLYCLTLSNGLQVDKNKVMREILNLINKDLNLKKKTIQWLRQKENLYDRKVLEIFKEPQYLQVLFQDYASNDMAMKRFSIKVLCFIYPMRQCEVIPFLKRVYYHIYDRLSSDNIANLDQRKQALKLTREILRHRTEIINDDSSSLCNFLYNHLYRAQDYQPLEMNLILVQLFKTIIDLVRKIPRSVHPFAYPISDYIIKLINSKDSEQKVKTSALSCLNQLIRGCSYVLVPYFHFKNLFDIIKELFKEGSRGIDHEEILRLLGNLGFVGKDKYDRIRNSAPDSNDPKEINKHFEKAYRETNYLKAIKNEKEVEVLGSSGWNGPYLFTKQQTTYTYIQITNFKRYILAKISKILSQHPSNIINYVVFKVLDSFIPILNKQEEQIYQSTILPQILKPDIVKQSPNHVFSTVSKIVLFQDTKTFCNVILRYLLSLLEDRNFVHKQQLLELVYIITCDYTDNDQKCDRIIRRIVEDITEHLSKKNLANSEIKISLKIIENLAESVNNLTHLFLPQFNKSFITGYHEICVCYFEVILTLCKKTQSTQFYLPPITESLIELLKNEITKEKETKNNNEIFIQKIIDFALCLMLIYGDKFKSFVIEFKTLVNEINGRHLLYQIAQDYMKKNSTLNYLSDAFYKYEIDELFKKRVELGVSRKKVKTSIEIPSLSQKVYSAVIQEFSCDKNEIEDQSEQWFNKICISLFEKSPELFVHECLYLVKEDRGFCYDIFPVAFYFFWKSLNQEGQKKLTNKLQSILHSKVISLSVKQKILDTVYFMDQWKATIPIKNQFLCEASTSVLDSAKALFYMQRLFEADPERYGEQLIEKYAALEEKQSAVGLLKVVKNLNTKTKILLNQKLKRHQDALRQFDMLEDNQKIENMTLEISIRKQMSDWDLVLKQCTTQVNNNPSFRSNLAPLAVEASIFLGKWDQVKGWLPSVPKNHDSFNLWKTMQKIHEKQYDEAEKYIKEDRKTIYPIISQLFNFSFERSMEGIVRLQQLCELEEATAYLKLEENLNKYEQNEQKRKIVKAEQKKRLQSRWNDRIEGCKQNLNSMQLILMTRNLLLQKTEDINNWIDYCHLAIKQTQSEVAKKTLEMLKKEYEDKESEKDDIKKKFEIDTLLIETRFILQEIKDEEAVAEIEKNIEEKGNLKSDQSMCRLYYNFAVWLSSKQNDFTVDKAYKCVEMLKKATTKVKNFIKGWHLMGLMHLKIDEMLKDKKKLDKKVSKIPEEEFENSILKQMKKQSHIYQALHCFIKSVSCGVKNHGFFLQDCLKIMNILFNQNQSILVDELHRNYTEIPAEGLIDIIPQIIGRLDIVEKPKLLDMMKKLLIHIGQNHPQSLVFCLVFLRCGRNETRKNIAEDIYNELIKTAPGIYEDTEKIVTELCKVSLKLNEKFKIWMGKIYDESCSKPPQKIAPKFLEVCRKIKNHSLVNLSLSEFGFLQQYKQQLSDIINCLTLYIEHGEQILYYKAKEIIRNILLQLQSSLKSIKKIELEEASPLLSKINNTRVCVPGSYNPNGNNVYISSFRNSLDVITSKQRPKKLIIVGSDSKQYLFLLKGKQDLRLDQRIMQLFSLINKMFHDPIESENYSIQRYSITPLSLETGLIEWVQNCDTIGELITEYRTATLGLEKVRLEYEISESICKQYKKLPKAHKVEIYKEIEARVSGNDLKNVFWIRSSNSEQWLKNRSCYTRSLAVMSMVGFVIGLGDRHPHNIMIQRNTGKVVHIDFGDCFDVTKTREQYPEKVPFRLTRMLVKNMESCGIHGIFKHTCEKIMKMLRSNKQSIIALVEAFRYDPIIGWKLNSKGEEQIIQNYENNQVQTEESYLDEEKDREKDAIEKTRMNRSTESRAEKILNEIKKKLGEKSPDSTNKVLKVEEQVNELIREAISPENLVDHYEGWSIYW